MCNKEATLVRTKIALASNSKERNAKKLEEEAIEAAVKMAEKHVRDSSKSKSKQAYYRSIAEKRVDEVIQKRKADALIREGLSKTAKIEKKINEKYQEDLRNIIESRLEAWDNYMQDKIELKRKEDLKKM